MKKIFLIAMALMMVAGMAYAEDRLTLNGSFFVRGWDQEGYDGKYSQSYDDQDEASWFEQRLRLGGKIAVADDVSVNFRMDIGEGVWGLDYTPGSVARPGATGAGRSGNTKIDFDRAFLKIDKEQWELTAGQQYMGLGVTQVFDVNATGFNLGFKFTDAMKLSLLYAKFDENGSTTDENDTKDVERYAANFGYTADAFSAKAFYIMGSDGTDVDDSPMAFGLNGSMGLGMFNLQAEFAYLSGDTAAGTIDYTGTQFFLGADANLTEMLKLGAEFFYAAGTDDPNEVQLTNLGDWDTFTPMGYNTPMSGFISGMPSWDVFDPFGISGGVMGGTLFVDFQVMEPLSLGAKIGYFSAEEDVNLPGAELMTYNAWIKYMIATNTYVTGTYMVSSPDADDVDPDDATVGVLELTIGF